ncbi:HNH endonuclease [Salmonella enterica]|nr:HNH endonuclease [Salmonella enterica]EBO9972194.1 HNH endonuclease [Salmonella enterica]EBP3368973.1 HNH endonuclease [Salmonella enterica]
MPNYNEYFSYDPHLGTLTWIKTNSPRAKAGSVVSYTSKQSGYVQVRLNGRLTMVHRIVWEMHFGPIPSGMEIDHINRIKNDNRLQNLRLVTPSDNCKNRGIRIDNKTGYPGVKFHKKNNNWNARITHNGIQVHLGCFDTFEKAKQARINAEKRKGVVDPINSN